MGIKKLFKNVRSFISNYINPHKEGASFLGYDKDYNASIPNVALSYSAVLSCVRVIAETIATLPLFVYKETEKGKEKAKKHSLYYILHESPNEETTAVSFFTSLITHVLLVGNAYVEIIFDRKGKVYSLNLLNANKVHVYRDDNNRLMYRYFKDKETIEFTSDKILHIAGLGWDGVMGYSPITLCRKQIATGLSQDNFANDFYSKGAKKTPILMAPAGLSETARINLKKTFRAGFDTGSVVLEDGITADFVTMNLTDAEFLANRTFNLQDICRIFRVPPHLVGDLSRSTNNNIEHQSIEFVQNTIRPYCVIIEQAMRKKLLSRKEKEDGYFIEFVMEGILRGDTKSRNESNKIMFDNGVLTRNEWRKRENMNDVSDEHGDEYFVSQQTRPLESAYTETKTNKNTNTNEDDKNGKKI